MTTLSAVVDIALVGVEARMTATILRSAVRRAGSRR